MIAYLYELLTGKPWTTVRSMAAEFGPPPAVRHHDKLATCTDAEVLLYGEQILAELREHEAAVKRLLELAHTDIREQT